MGSTGIVFNEIPATTRKPGNYMEFNFTAAKRLLPTNDQPVVIIAQGAGAYSQVPLIPFDVYDTDSVGVVCGFGSLAHRMVKTMRWANRYVSLQMVLLNESGGSAWEKASATVVIAGRLGDGYSLDGGGLAELTIGSDTVRVTVDAAMHPSDVRDALLAAVNANQDLPVVAEAVGETSNLKLTVKTAGWIGNLLRISSRATAAGLTLTPPGEGVFATDEVEPSVGTFQAALDAIVAAGHKVIVMPYTDTTHMAALRDHLAFVSNGVEQRGAISVAVTDGDTADAKTLAASQNSGRMVNGLLPASPSWAPEVAAALAGVKVSESDPARPLDDLPLVGIAQPPLNQRLSRTAQEDLLHHGVTPLEVGPGNQVQVVRMISTYTINPLGVTDPTLLDITAICSADYVRIACRTAWALALQRQKNSASVRRKGRSVLLHTLYQLEELEIVQDVDANKDMLVVLPDDNEAGRANARIPAAIVPGLHVLAAVIDLL